MTVCRSCPTVGTTGIVFAGYVMGAGGFDGVRPAVGR